MAYRKVHFFTSIGSDPVCGCSLGLFWTYYSVESLDDFLKRPLSDRCLSCDKIGRRRFPHKFSSHEKAI